MPDESGRREPPPVHPRMRGTASATLALNERTASLKAAGRSVYRFGFGQSPFPIPHVVVESLKLHAHAKDYLPVRGLPELREAVARHNARVRGLSVSPMNVIIGPGSKELMFLCQMALDAELLLQSPSWVSYAPQARLLQQPTVWLPTSMTDRWLLTADTLANYLAGAAPRQRLLVLNYPNNPTGTTYHAGELRAIADVAREHGLIVLADEIYGRLHHHGAHVSLAQYYSEGTLVSSGLSKWCGAGGWRLGTLVVPDELSWLADAIALGAGETFSTVSAPVQHAAVTAFTAGHVIDEYVQQTRRILRTLGAHAATALRAGGWELCDPEGAFYLYALDPRAPQRDLPGSEALAADLLERTGVVTLAGAAFGRPAEEPGVRVAYVDFDGEKALELAREVPMEDDLDLAFLRAACPRVVDGIVRMAEYPSRPRLTAAGTTAVR